MSRTLVVSLSLVFALSLVLAPADQVYSKANKTKKKKKVRKKRKLSKRELRKKRYRKTATAWMAEWKKKQDETRPKKGRSKSFLYQERITRPVLGMTWGISMNRYPDREYSKGIFKEMQILNDDAIKD